VPRAARRRCSFAVTSRSAAPPEVVFDVVADGPGWVEWTSVRRSTYEREGVPAPHGVGAIRNFAIKVPLRRDRYRVVSREECVGYDRPRRFSYTLLAGLPIRDYRADVDFESDPSGGGGTVISWAGSFEPKIPGTGLLLRTFLRRTVQRFATSAARHAEVVARRRD
jgi:Polyketide cyclase / dehydrase and lipid transport